MYDRFSFVQLDKLIKRLQLYNENCQKARQEIAMAFTNEEFTKLVQVSKDDPPIAS